MNRHKDISITFNSLTSRPSTLRSSRDNAFITKVLVGCALYAGFIVGWGLCLLTHV
jgi:hypothetical protein